jgi:hypothetical protein
LSNLIKSWVCASFKVFEATKCAASTSRPFMICFGETNLLAELVKAFLILVPA